MNFKRVVSYQIDAMGTLVTYTEEEAKELYAELHKLFGEKTRLTRPLTVDDVYGPIDRVYKGKPNRGDIFAPEGWPPGDLK